MFENYNLEIDYETLERIRQELIDRYGTLAQIYPAAYSKVDEVERADPDTLIQMALDEKIITIEQNHTL